MQVSGAKAYLVNTGWNGTGKRITIKDTRGIIDAILSGDILKAETKKIPMFDLEVPTALPGVNPAILDPRDTYTNVEEWETKARIWLAGLSRTSSSTRATTQARLWSRLAPSCNQRHDLPVTDKRRSEAAPLLSPKDACFRPMKVGTF